MSDPGVAAIEARLLAALGQDGLLTVAVSGGVDSMTLAVAAHRHRPAGATAIVHAVSPAVPRAATERVRARGAAEGWRLDVVGAGEFEDARYRANPVDRCYFCKSNLYDRIRALMPDGTIASGANLDDLSDYRPGLQAAAERDIVHPFIEAGIGKADIRKLARHYGLREVAERPAEPCLSSRVQTGIAIAEADLAFIERTEAELAALMPPGAAVRCRVTSTGIAIELDAAAPENVDMRAQALCAAHGRRYLGIRPYRRGSAFVGRKDAESVSRSA